MDNNPFNCNAPATGSQFFGRTKFLSTVLDTIASATDLVPVIFGLPRYGKTSVLLELANLLSAEDYVPVYWNLGDNAHAPWDRALLSLAAALAKASPEIQPDPESLWDEAYLLDDFLPRVIQAAAPKRLVLLVDDIDLVTFDNDDGTTAAGLIRNLGLNQPSVSLVLTTGTELGDGPAGWSPLEQSLQTGELPPLTPTETEALITDLSRSSQVSFSSDAIEIIIRYCVGHPFLIQLICYEALETAVSNGDAEVQAKTISAVFLSVLEKCTPAIEPLVEGLSDRQLETLTACAILSSEKVFLTPKDVSDYLRSRQILIDERETGRVMAGLEQRFLLNKEMQGVYAFRVPLLAHWVIKSYATKFTMAKPMAKSKSVLIGLGVFLVAILISIGFWSLFTYWSTSDSASEPVIAAVDTPPGQSEPATIPPTVEPDGQDRVEPTVVATAASTPTLPPTTTPVQEPTEIPTATPTLQPTETATEEPTATPTPTASSEPTEEPTPTPTATATVTATSTDEPTPAPAIVATPEPSPAPDPDPLPGGLQILDLDVITGREPALIYAVAKDRGVYRRDEAGSWSLFSRNLADAGEILTLGSRAGSVISPTLFAGYGDGARSWNDPAGWSTKTPAPRFHDIVPIPGTSIVFAGSETGIYRSLDDGLTWEPVNIRLSGRLIEVPIYSLAVGQNTSESWTVYAVGGDSAVIFKTTVEPAEEAAIRNIEPRWEDVPCNCEADRTFYAVATDPTNDQLIYVGNDRSRISFSSDGGMSWTTSIVPVGQAQEVFVTEIEVAPGSETAFAATGDELAPIRSNGLLVLDGQNYWTAALPPGFVPGQDYVASIAIDTSDPETVYVGGSNGLYKFDSSSQDWTEAP